MDKAEKIFAKMAEDYTREGLLTGGLVTGIPALGYIIKDRKKIIASSALNIATELAGKSPPRTVAEAEQIGIKAVAKAKKGARIALPLTVLGMGFMGAGIGGVIGTYIKKKPIPRRKS